MNLLNKDFVTPKERLSYKITVEKQSPLHLAKIYLAAEKEAVRSLGSSENINIIKVLCGWLSNDFSQNINL